MVEALAEVHAESLAARRARYAALFAGTGRPRFWLYESAALTGRLLGPESFAVEKLYRAAGLGTTGGELPDHVSMELAFLAHLVEQGADDAERSFIEHHAGRWLPELGRGLARSGDEVYAPIGQLLAEWLEEVGQRQAADRQPPTADCLPFIPHAEACTLCGFCAQVCPTRALAVRETAGETRLMLKANACVGCGQCERICDAHALTLTEAVRSSETWRVLRHSPRVACHACGQPMVSRAELDFVAAQIGHPAWLEYCLRCRSQMMEVAQ